MPPVEQESEGGGDRDRATPDGSAWRGGQFTALPSHPYASPPSTDWFRESGVDVALPDEAARRWLLASCVVQGRTLSRCITG